MVDKCSSYSMTVFETLDFRSDMTYRMFRSKFFVCKCPGDTIILPNTRHPGTHRVSNARGLPGGDARGWN